MAKTLLEVLYENQIKVIQRGERWVAHCPLHTGDNNPSFTIYPDMTFHCFGCKAHGDVITFLEKHKGMPYLQAVEYAGLPERRRIVKRVIKVSNTFSSYEYLAGIADQYHQFLLGIRGAIDYLHFRGLTDETINRFNLGFTDGGVVDPQSAYDMNMALTLGVLSENAVDHSVWETLAQRITIPNMISSAGTRMCDFIMGRTVAKSKIKYLGLRIPKPLYGLREAMQSDTVFLVEGHFDWLILKQWGFPAIVSGGINIPSYNLLPLRSRRLVIVPDNDAPGMESAQSIASRVPNSIILDYSRLGVKDVGELGTESSGKDMFTQCVEEQTGWKPSTLMAMSPESLRLLQVSKLSV